MDKEKKDLIAELRRYGTDNGINLGKHMAELTEAFNPKSCEELTGYTFRDIIAMYEDYDHMAKEIEEIRNIGEYERGWAQGRKDTMRAYGINEGEQDG